MFYLGCSSIKEGTSSELKELEKARLEVRQLAKGSSKKGARRSLMAVPDEPFQHSDDVDFEIDESTSYVIFASFYELYNEKVYDLLVPVPKDKKRVGLSVNWGGHRQIEKATFYRFCRFFVAFLGTDKNYKNFFEKRQSVAFLSLYCRFFAFF